MRQVVLAELRHNGRRALGAALAIGIAVAFVVTVLGATATMQDFLRRSGAGALLVADAVVEPSATAQDPPAMTDADLARVSGLPAVRSAYAQRSTYLQVTFRDGPSGGAVIAAPPDALRWYTLEQGREPAAPGEVLTDAATARSAGLAVGSTLSAVMPGSQGPVATAGGGGAAGSAGAVATGVSARPVTLHVVGIVPSVALSAGRAFIAREADIRTWDPQAQPERILAVAAPGVDPVTLRQDLSAALPALQVREPVAAADASIGGPITVLTVLLLAFTAVSLGVAVIVIANTFAIVLAQRTAQLALVRCVGGTRRQIYRSVMVEAAVVGLVSSVVGALVGALVVVGTVAALSRVFVEVDGMQPVVPVSGLVIAVVVGLLVTVVAARWPARRATKVAPLAALRPDTLAQVRRSSRLRIVAGTVLLVGGGPSLAALTVTVPAKASTGEAQVRTLAGMAAGFVAVLGVVLAGPVLVPWVARVLGRPLGALGPVGRLAVASTTRNPVRAAATSTALFVGVCLITLMSVGAATVTAAANSRLAARYPVDVSVTGLVPQRYLSGGGGVDPARLAGGVSVPAAAVAAVAGLDGVQASVPLRSGVLSVDGAPRTVFTADLAALTAVLRSPSALRTGTIVLPADDGPVPTAPAPSALTGSGGRLTLTTRYARVPVPLVAPQDFERLVAAADRVPAGAMLVRVTDDVDAGAFTAALNTALDRSGAASGPEYAFFDGKVAVGGSLPQRAQWEQAMNVLLWIATGLLGVAVLISLVGIGNTMALSVLERRREIGVQRAVGLTRRQLRQSLLLEAVLLALVGTVVGVVLGIGFGFAGARLLMAGTATVDSVSVPLDRVALVVAVAVVAAVVAALVPGRRAGRISPTEALAAT